MQMKTKRYSCSIRNRLITLLAMFHVAAISLSALPVSEWRMESGNDNTMQNMNKKTIRGVVVNQDGEPEIGVTVMVPGTQIGTTTDVNGAYVLEVPSNTTVIEFSYIGMKTQTIQLKGKNTVNITLESDAIAIDEVTVVAYGVQKKATVTGSIASVDSKQLVQSSQANISNALVGRMSGLTGVQKSGEPGNDKAIIRIRGIGTFAAGYDSDMQNPLVMVDGIEVDNYNNIDPNEIDNVSILKDASATAVYGVRGANGVILITTKRGNLSKPQVSVSTNTAIVSFANMRKLMNAYEWAQGFNETYLYDGIFTGNYSPKFTEEELVKMRDHTDPVFWPDTDWVDMIFKKSSIQTQHNINVRGGTDRVKYFISVGAFTQGGLYNNTKLASGGDDYDAQTSYDRYNFRTNFDFDVTKRLKISLQVADQMEFHNHSQQTSEYLLSNAYNHPPISGPGIYDGKLIESIPGRYSASPNPLFGLFLQERHGHWKDYYNQLQTSVKGTYDLGFLLKGLSVHATISYQNYNIHQTRYSRYVRTYDALRDPEDLENPVPILKPKETTSLMNKEESFGKNRRTYFETGINYSNRFGNHNVGALLLYNQSKYHDPNLKYAIPNAYQGVVGRVMYDYKSRYLVEFNMGYNGTENFAKGSRFGFFPAFSAGWVVTEESFFPKNDILTFLKIRGSYGEVGNDKIGGERFLYLPTVYEYDSKESWYNDGVAYYFGTLPSNFNKVPYTANEGLIGNPDLTWERAKKMNIGADIYLFKDKVRITADYFHERRTNILTTRSIIPTIVGASFPAYNLGKMTNRGVDGEITYRDRVGIFNYWAKGIFTFARNKVEYMEEVPNVYSYQNKTGQPHQQFYGLIAEGFYNTWEEVNDVNRPVSSWNNNRLQPGDVKYRDVNGDGIIDNFDMVPIGYTPFPEISYGFSLGGDIKGFDFSVLFSGAARTSVATATAYNRGWQQDGSAISYLRDWSWTQEKYENGENIRFPHLSAHVNQEHNYVQSTLWVRDGSYLRLKNAEVGYTFAGNLLKKIGLTSARIYVNGTNLLTWDSLFPGEDPENPSGSTASYPLVKTVNFGLNINF